MASARADNLLAIPPELIPDYDTIVVHADAPLRSIYCERQARLLTGTLHDSWAGPHRGGDFLAFAGVGLYYALREPPLVPDVTVCQGLRLGDLVEKCNNSYFLWEHGIRPDVVIEIVADARGGELAHKRERCQLIGATYYVVWDPFRILGDQRLHAFALHATGYQVTGPAFPSIGLGVSEWHGLVEGAEERWLRWSNLDGRLIPTAAERADRLAEKLRSLGVDPDAP